MPRSRSARLSSPGGVPLWLGLLALVTALLVAAAGYVGTRHRGESAASLAAPTSTAPISGVVGLVVEPDDARAPILAELAAAKASIKLSVYLLSDDAIIEALSAAAERGVRVQVLLEEHPFGGGGGQDAIFARLAAAGIDVRWSDPVYRFSHIKTFVIDDRVTLIMELNLANSAFTQNRELAVISTRPDDVAQAAAIFAVDWERGGTTPAGPLVVSPANSRQALLDLIDGATATLDIYAEVVRDDEMVAAIAAAAARGVRVRLVMSGAANDANAAGRAALAAAGVAVHLSSELYIHAKMFLADERALFVGSQNLTATSLDQNRELGIIVTDHGSIERARRVFARDFRAAPEEGR